MIWKEALRDYQLLQLTVPTTLYITTAVKVAQSCQPEYQPPSLVARHPKFRLSFWGGSRGGSGGSVKPPKLKEENTLTCAVSDKKNKMTVKHSFYISASFFICLLGKIKSSLFTLLSPKVVIFGNY